MLLSSLCAIRRHMKPGIVFAAAICAGPFALFAEPLDKAACDSLQAEKQALVVLGVDKEMAKGPEWAKANLAQADLNLLKRFLNLDEQLKFRCGMAVVTLQIPDEAEDGPDDDAAADVGLPPMPLRRDQAMVKPAAKPATGAPKPQPAAVKPAARAAPAAAPVKPAPKAAPAKPQSSWNTQTSPVEAATPAAVEQIDIRPRQERGRQPETGDRG